MSTSFKFNLEKEGWVVVQYHEDGYGNHRTSKGRWSNQKYVTVWETLSGELVAELGLTQGFSCLIDLDDLENVCQHNWVAAKDGGWGIRVGCHNKETKKFTLLHKFLYDKSCMKNQVVDHINEQFTDSYALDNRKVNIRFTDKNTHNVRKYKSNTTGEPNIIVNKRGKLNVQVTLNEIRYHCPYYDSGEIISAIYCRDLFKIVLHKHKGHNISDTNFIKYSKDVLDVYEGIAKPSKTTNNLKILFNKIRKIGGFDLDAKISEIRQRVREQLNQM